MKEGRSTFKIVTGKHIGKRLLGKSRSKWEDNIKMGLKEMDVSTRNWVYSAQDMSYWRCL